jgi:trehalose synthase
MARRIEVSHHLTLDNYSDVATLASAVRDLREEGRVLVPRLTGRRIWMVSSTAQGGGVAEMLPAQIAILRDLGLDVGWLVIEPDDPAFFPLTKRIHNLIHGEGDPQLGPVDRELYDTESRRIADRLETLVAPGDLVIIHDPQPLGAGAILKERQANPLIWRCHIGLDKVRPQTSAAWDFVRPYTGAYDHAIFSVPEYIPSYLAGRSTIIHPAIDPLSPKNRELSIQKIVTILCDADLMQPRGPLLEPLFSAPARRFQDDGKWGPATEPEDFGLLFRPVVTQVSRWDRLKGFAPLLDGFRVLKEELAVGAGVDERQSARLSTVRMVLAGPEPSAVADDPEAEAVLEELQAQYLELSDALRRDVALIALPMESLDENALMVNALQRSSTVVAQNSLREGFGLTATEGMWKHVPVMGSSAAGLRQQVRDGIDGQIVGDPCDSREIAETLREMLADERLREEWGRTAQRRVYENFLIFPQLRRWLTTMVEVVTAT